MIFGKTYNARNRTSDDWWHKIFAWLPVEIEDGRKVWLQFVERKTTWYPPTINESSCWKTRYRLIGVK